MALIYTDANLVEQGYLSGASMDWQEEADDNSFSLEMGLEDYGKLVDGCYVFDEDYPQFGGRVQKVRVNTATNGLILDGKTFAGILSEKILKPESGQDYLNISGTIGEKIEAVLTLVNLTGVFYTEITGDTSSNWKVDRYTDALSALRKLAKENSLVMYVQFNKSHSNAKLQIIFDTPHHVEAGQEYESDLFAFDIQNDYRPVNHLICLGSGVLKARTVIELYSNSSGVISKIQDSSLTGDKEVEAVFDYGNAESDEELEKAGIKRFQEILDNATKLEITPPEEAVFKIGDTIAGKEQITGIYVEKEVKKIIYKAQDDLPPSITYETTETKKG